MQLADNSEQLANRIKDYIGNYDYDKVLKKFVKYYIRDFNESYKANKSSLKKMKTSLTITPTTMEYPIGSGKQISFYYDKQLDPMYLLIDEICYNPNPEIEFANEFVSECMQMFTSEDVFIDCEQEDQIVQFMIRQFDFLQLPTNSIGD